MTREQYLALWSSELKECRRGRNLGPGECQHLHELLEYATTAIGQERQQAAKDRAGMLACMHRVDQAEAERDAARAELARLKANPGHSTRQDTGRCPACRHFWPGSAQCGQLVQRPVNTRPEDWGCVRYACAGAEPASSICVAPELRRRQ
jgi:hypothetical protein